MIAETEIRLTPKQAYNQPDLLQIAARKLNIKPVRINHVRIVKRSLDARKPEIKVNLRLAVVIDEPGYQVSNIVYNAKQVGKSQPVIIIGAGPAGLFAALRLVELGIKPIILERGHDVSTRKRDIARLYRGNVVNPDSNYAFGEGGAGTFSDGKLYTRSSKRGDISLVLNWLVFHGADASILYDAHPHIGSDKLPGIVAAMRKTILDAGGEIHFNSRVTDILWTNGEVKSIKLTSGDSISCKYLILATGHSARDIYKLLHKRNLLLEFKPFAMGVRIEHPQELINKLQYKSNAYDNVLPSATYSLVAQVKNRGVFSFCMCPGGSIIQAASEPGQNVVNGMSPSHRNGVYANAGWVSEVRWEDIPGYQKHGPLAGLEFQENLEQIAFETGSGLTSPAQRITDFIKNKKSSDLNPTSYIPGLVSCNYHTWLPEFLCNSLQEGLNFFDKKMPGFGGEQGQMIGLESRTSSPVRIPRDSISFQHPQVRGLFPCGEGAGYAGGITSSAIDGINVATAIARMLSIDIPD